MDALAFSFVQEHFSGADLEALRCILSPYIRHIGFAERRGGVFGFACSAEINLGGLVAWGGEHQRGRVFVSLMGVGCSMVTDWPGLVEQLQRMGARLARVDLAYDDLEGSHYSVDAAIADYEGGAFTLSGRPPSFKLISSGVAGETPARTFYVGKRENGKMCRVYTKGVQLRDVQHPNWVRVEVELRAQDRLIPWEALLQPAAFLAGSYPALGWISAVKAAIKTAKLIVEKTLDQMIEWGQRQVGKVLHAAAMYYGGDYFAAFDRLRVPELPKRLLGTESLLGAA